MRLQLCLFSRVDQNEKVDGTEYQQLVNCGVDLSVGIHA